MAARVQKLNELLTHTKNEAIKFNHKESLFEKEKTDYSKLIQIDKDF